MNSSWWYILKLEGDHVLKGILNQTKNPITENNNFYVDSQGSSVNYKESICKRKSRSQSTLMHSA